MEEHKASLCREIHPEVDTDSLLQGDHSDGLCSSTTRNISIRGLANTRKTNRVTRRMTLIDCNVNKESNKDLVMPQTLHDILGLTATSCSS